MQYINPQQNFHFVIPVWGRAYTQLFVDICLPMLLTPGNLEASRGHQDHFVIATTWRDWVYMSQTDSFKDLAAVMPIEHIIIDGLIDLTNPHHAMSECYARAMALPTVVPNYTDFVFLTPDSFWSEGAFKRLRQLAQEGYKVVMAPGLRVEIETVAPLLKEWLLSNAHDPSMPVEQLVRIVIDHMHQISRANNWLDSEGFINNWPSHVFWIDDRTHKMIAHCFHMHPLMVRAPATIPNIGDTIDGVFLERLPYKIDQYYVVQEDFLGVEMSPAERNLGQPLGAPSVEAVKRFGMMHANAKHWYFFSKRIILSGDDSAQIPLEIISNCDTVIAQILASKPKHSFMYSVSGLANKIRRRPRLKRLLYGPYKIIKCLYKFSRRFKPAPSHA